MGYLDGFRVTFGKLFKGTDDRAARSPSPTSRTPARSATSPSASTAATSSTATRTAWRSASAASCAPACARPGASTCAGADNPPDDPVSPGERYGFVYEINYLRCIHCDLCVEACPTEAITESKLFEFSFTNRQDAIYTKAELVVDDDGHAPAAAVGGLVRPRRRSPPSLGLGAGHRAVGRRRLRGRRGLVRRAGLRREAARARPVRRPTDDPRRRTTRPTRATTPTGGHH